LWLVSRVMSVVTFFSTTQGAVKEVSVSGIVESPVSAPYTLPPLPTYNVQAPIDL
jgi:hypothetical protein